MDDLDDICRLVDHWALKGENLDLIEQVDVTR